ncbi:hypothetical protein BX600DRAFT_435721 [Xylariales sp. PMI_506]|nr:hypothetical protein BX600DRAFT_435721 [Xylariales sp. PMI_506]
MAKDRDSDTGQASQSKRPPLNHHVSHDSDSQVSDHTSTSHSHHRPKKHVVGGGRLHSRVPSSKALSKNSRLNLHHHNTQPRRQPSPSPERSERMQPSGSHRRTSSSEVRLSRDLSATNLKTSTSHTALKRNRSHVEVGKKSKSSANIKRSSSHKDVSKLKSGKGTVHFDLGNDGQEDEWVDASASASPYLSRRGSVVSSVQSVAKPAASDDEEHEAHENGQSQASAPGPGEDKPIPDRETVQHKEYLTSRLLQRTPSYAFVPPHSASPDSALSRTSSAVYDSPKPTTTPADGLTSRFVNGPGSGVTPETGSFYSPVKGHDRMKRPRSLGNLHHDHHDSLGAHSDDENDSALAPRTRRAGYRAAPAEKSRTQQKLNLQRASSSIEPTPAVTGVGTVGTSPLVGGGGYDNRDPRVSKLLERTGMEYLVVRRYQNPIARSVARLQQLPSANKSQHILPKQNGSGPSGSMHSKKPSFGLSSSLAGDIQSSQPPTPRRTHAASIRTNGANSSYEIDEGSYEEGEDAGGVSTLLRNMWEKAMDLSVSQD